MILIDDEPSLNENGVAIGEEEIEKVPSFTEQKEMEIRPDDGIGLDSRDLVPLEDNWSSSIRQQIQRISSTLEMNDVERGGDLAVRGLLLAVPVTLVILGFQALVQPSENSEAQIAGNKLSCCLGFLLLDFAGYSSVSTLRAACLAQCSTSI